MDNIGCSKRRMMATRITVAAFVLLIPMLQCLPVNDGPFTLTNKATGFCLVKKSTRCLDMRWTTGGRIFLTSTKKCLGAQGKSAGSEVNFYDCNDKSDLQKWECMNETLLALANQKLFIEIKSDETVALTKTIGPNNHLTITGTSSGACTRTYRELYTIEGNAFGKPCMFPFLYKDRWFADCTTYDHSGRRPWCAVETKYERELWGNCPTTSTEHWRRNSVTGAVYQVNTQSALMWSQADTSCKQQGATLLSITDPNEQAFVTAFMGSDKYKLWIGLVLNQEQGWHWTDGRPYRYLRWNSGNPLPNPGHNCAILDSSVQYSWQSSTCDKKMGYICYKDGAPPPPIQVEVGFCPSPWIPYNGHCFYLQRTKKSWLEAQRECRKEGGDLAAIQNVEDHSFVISQLGYAPTDELWIGLNDIKTEKLFEWSDHSTVTFTSWAYGEPTVSTETEDCVLITGENGNWADRTCDEKFGFICKKMSETDRPAEEVQLDMGCQSGWKRHGSYCYFVGSETKTFDEASEDCKSSSSYLADVQNGVDNAFLVSLVGIRPEKYFWIGLSNQKNIDLFEWTNTVFVKFTHWNVLMPGHEQGCVAMTTGIFSGLWDLLPCTNKEKYICKKLAEGAVVTEPPPTVSPPQCAEGWTRVGTRNYCSKFFTGPRASEKTWFEARDFCRAIGGDLLSIHSKADQQLGRSHGRAWIGLRSTDSTAGYTWSDGTPVNFQHWQDGEPNNFNNAEACVEFRMYNWDESGSWNDVHCESYNDWLCQIRAGVTPKPPPNNTAVDYNITSDGWYVWRGNQYFVNGISMAMEDARHYCQQKHGDLVVINSEAENVFLWKLVSRNYGTYYIGLKVDYDRSIWWLDGSSVGFRRWNDNQPDFSSYDENCAAMTYYMGFWQNCNCGKEFQSICKRSGSAPVNTTAAPTVPPKGGCPLTWKKFESKCYSIVTNRKSTWEDARLQCISTGGSLVSIVSKRIQTFLISQMAESATTDLWIGLNSIKGEGFFWSDGKQRRYTNWGNSGNRRYKGSFYQRWNEEQCVLLNSNPTLGIGKWMIKSCNDTNGFVCHRGVDPNTPVRPNPVPTTYVNMANDSIKAVTRNLTWADARKYCEGDKAKLASLRNEWTQAYVELLAITLQVPLWIGLNKGETDGYFRYIDGWHMNIANWAENEPSQNRPCVYVDVEGNWKTAFCNQTMNSVCMMSTEVPPTESSTFPGICPEEAEVGYQNRYSWIPFRGYCYLFITDEIEWPDAASQCVIHGGVLTSIEDPPEQDFLQTKVKIFEDQTSFWIGLYKTHKGQWLWLDKTVVDYSNWDQDEPDDDDTYGQMSSSTGAWRTGRRWHDRGYICKTSKVIPVDFAAKNEKQIQETRRRIRTSLTVVLVITAISTLTVIAFFIYKRPRPVLSTFDNPLYFDSERSQPDVVDTNKLIEKAEEVNPEPIITL